MRLKLFLNKCDVKFKHIIKAVPVVLLPQFPNQISLPGDASSSARLSLQQQE